MSESPWSHFAALHRHFATRLRPTAGDAAAIAAAICPTIVFMGSKILRTAIRA
jgi:hypothetical protein